jgi:hypothetical protein
MLACDISSFSQFAAHRILGFVTGSYFFVIFSKKSLTFQDKPIIYYFRFGEETTLWDEPKLCCFDIFTPIGVYTIMQVNKTAVAVFILGCLIFPVQAQCVVMTQITPSNVVLPATAGEIFSFDFVVDANAINATSFGATISVSGPGSLTLDKPASAAVTGEGAYWVYGNSYGVIIKTPSGNSYSFEDNPLNGNPEPLATDDIVARYAFKWGGTVGDYTFVLNLDTQYSYIQNGDFIKEPLGFAPGSYPGNSNSFTVNVPEPSTLVIFVLGSAVLLKKRST